LDRKYPINPAAPVIRYERLPGSVNGYLWRIG